MQKKVLIADDDQELLLVLKEGMEKNKEEFEVLLAGDGESALNKLESNPVSLVVADLKMPGMDGFSLLSQIAERYPDIPVIIITAYGSPHIREMVHQNGAAGYLEKPFLIDDLFQEIRSVLSREADGGTLHGISLAMFLQLIDMEQKTCTLRVQEKGTGKEGSLFFKNGELLEARTGSQHGEEAAYTILSWDDIQISIQNSCNLTEKRIERDPQAILMDAMRQKDESQEVVEEEPELLEDSEESEEEGIKEEVKHSADSASRINMEDVLARIESRLGEKSRVEDVAQDASWDEILRYGESLGEVFGAGSMKFAFVDSRTKGCKFLLPGNPTTVVSVTRNCPREKMIQVLRA